MIEKLVVVAVNVTLAPGCWLLSHAIEKVTAPMMNAPEIQAYLDRSGVNCTDDEWYARYTDDAAAAVA